MKKEERATREKRFEIHIIHNLCFVFQLGYSQINTRQ